ncbi:MAG TPA: sugar phosphate nucleotidyltransferase [Vicinamibacterales bacterium]|jgi:glucose-1-phosphate cytidylyltransferase
MKVVLFCGGLGMRIRDNENVPKPMITIGYRPLVWHLMKYYAHFGFKDFVLCLGYRADYIKNYFLTYNECESNDFTLSEGGKRLELLKSDISDWRITFVDTGLNSNIGQRLKAVEKHLAGEEMFLANYSDGLTDLPLDEHVAHFTKHGKIASFVSVRPNLSFHVVQSDEHGRVLAIEDIAKSHLRINGGFFIFRREIFDHMRDGEELVNEPFQRLLQRDELMAYRYDGFWQAMDTFKDRQALEQRYSSGDAPWEVWKRSADNPAPKSVSHTGLDIPADFRPHIAR